MAVPTSSGRSSRTQRAQQFRERLTALIGLGALVVMLGAIGMVIHKRLSAPSGQEIDAYARDTKTPTWSGRNTTEQALMDALSERKPVAPVQEGTPGSGVAVAKGGGVPNTTLSPAAAALKPHPSTAAEPSISITDPLLAASTLSGIEDIESKRERIAADMQAFFDARTLEAKLAHVRDPARVQPLMQSFYSREPMPVWKWRGIGRAVRVDEPGYRFGYVQALFEDASTASVIVEETPDGHYLIDWEYLVRYGDLSWTDFLRMKPVEPKLLRVIASKPNATPSVSALAPATSEWLELRHPDESGTVLGWFDRSDPKYASLVKHLEDGHWKDVPVTLLLCYPTQPTRLSGEGVRISGVEGKGWIILSESKPHG